jgi:pyruvyl transferase EpsO
MNNKNIYLNNIKEQQRLLYGCLEQLLSTGSKVALLDFPNHNNVGDNAIWLGEKTALRKMGVEVVYQCDIYTFSEKALRKKLGSGGIVLLHGGGNLGSVWPEHQRFRERMITLLYDMKIIQLPQSVYFDNEKDKQQFGEIARKHQNLNILVRDKVSLDLLKELDLNVELCPDMAFALGSLATIGKPKVDAVWLARTDHESAGNSIENTNLNIEKLDWLMGEPGRYYSKFSPKITVRIRRLVQRIFRNSAFTRNNLWEINANLFDLLAQRRLNRGIRILSRGKIVITDRLHGHIISALLGKPQILFDNHYKKIGNYRACFEPKHDAIFYDPSIKSGIENEISKILAASKNINDE